MIVGKYYLFYELLQVALGHKGYLSHTPTEEEWYNIYKLSERHALLGVIFYGVRKSGLRPPLQLLFQWIADNEVVRHSNEIANMAVQKVCRYFEQKGFRSCILKGQGNTFCYPDPFIRTSGDIDIWLDGGRGKILKMVNEKWTKLLERYHHVEIPAVDGVPVEVHFFPSYMHSPRNNKRLQEWFERFAGNQFANKVVLPGQQELISIPTADFNLIYQLQHMFSHLFTEGFGLRQVVDYYFVLINANLTNVMEIQKTLHHLGLYKFAGAMMWVMKDVLCLEDKYIIVEPDEKEGRFLLSEIMQSGNMGHYDIRLGKTSGEGVIHRYFRMTYRNMRFIRHYPEEALCEPLFRTWYYFWRKTH